MSDEKKILEENQPEIKPEEVNPELSPEEREELERLRREKSSQPQVIYMQAPAPQAIPATQTQFTTPKGGGFPAFASLCIPGGGQMLNGNIGAGICYLIGTGVGCMFGLIPGVIIYFMSIFNAYRGK